uniref:Uncharacterized protein n=1 Tax=Anguilla anguilla TaxID=7936 RepID=A0A0E9R0F0_ANGAN
MSTFYLLSISYNPCRLNHLVLWKKTHSMFKVTKFLMSLASPRLL